MKRIKAITEIKVSVDDINHLNALIDRDEPKPPVVKRYSADGGEYTVCPVCARLVSDNYHFCSQCGQRIDRENVAI